MNSKPLKIYLLCRYAAGHSLYEPWVDKTQRPVEIVSDSVVDWTPPKDCGIVVGHEHFRWEEASKFRRIQTQQRIPTLMLADGILEFRNSFENPKIPELSMYQPLLTDKIACIGKRSAEIISSWGNVGKVEIVGLPRLDRPLEIARLNGSKKVDHDSFKLLVVTATTPAFTAEQREKVVDSLRCIKANCSHIGQINGRRIQIQWRLTDGLESDVEVDPPNVSHSLFEAIESADAVITTPSTIYLESAILRKPTAILDFNNSPQYLTSAWNISAETHVQEVILGLADPSPSKMAFQNFQLRDQLQTEEVASDRMVELVNKMIDIGQQARQDHKPLDYAQFLLSSPNSPSLTEVEAMRKTEKTQFEKLRDEKVGIESELKQAVHRLGTLPTELAEKNEQITQLQSALDESRRRLADVRSRLFKLRKILGIGKENQDHDNIPAG